MAKLIWIDDEVDLLKPHIVFLENKGYTVTPVNNVNEALEMIEKENLLSRSVELGKIIRERFENIGKAFALLCGEEENERLCRLGDCLYREYQLLCERMIKEAQFS